MEAPNHSHNNIPTSDLDAPFQDSTSIKQLTAARIAKAEAKRKAGLFNATKLVMGFCVPKFAHLHRESTLESDSSDSSSDCDAKAPKKEDKPERTPKAKLTAKEKAAAREEKAGGKRQRTKARKVKKEEKRRFT